MSRIEIDQMHGGYIAIQRTYTVDLPVQPPSVLEDQSLGRGESALSSGEHPAPTIQYNFTYKYQQLGGVQIALRNDTQAPESKTYRESRECI